MNENIYTLILITLEVLFAVVLLRTLHRSSLKMPHVLIIGGVFILWLSTVYILISQKFYKIFIIKTLISIMPTDFENQVVIKNPGTKTRFTSIAIEDPQNCNKFFGKYS